MSGILATVIHAASGRSVAQMQMTLTSELRVAMQHMTSFASAMMVSGKRPEGPMGILVFLIVRARPTPQLLRMGQLHQM